jgi:serine/threonine protein phosphatase 1
MNTNSFHFTSDIPPDSTISLGDVHGQIELLEQFVNWVRGSDARVIFLGDLCDRAKNPGDDLRVLELVRHMCESPEDFGLASCVSLRGNHEQLLLYALYGYGYSDWVRNGGDYENLENFREYEPWLRSLPLFVTVNDTLFSHTGGFHGVDPAIFLDTEDAREQLVWAREAPSKGSGLAKWSKTLKRSVFGHTPKSAMPYVAGDAICIDTGCYHFGTLTTYNSRYNTFMSFEAE